MREYENYIPVALITDENMPAFLCTALVSMLENCKPDTFYQIYCFVSDKLGSENIRKIVSTLEVYDNCSLDVINMGDTYEDSLNRHPTITNACLYKFAMINALPQHDKIIYLDTDIMVTDDLTDLYNIDLRDNYIGGVFNVFYYMRKPHYAEMLGIPDLESYINAGVMLMNLKKMREDNILPVLESYIGKFQNSVDQHIFNKVCYGKIMNIPPRYNVTLKYKEMYEKTDMSRFYTPKELSDTINQPAIIHYTGRRKPWSYSDVYLAWKWYGYYKKTAYGKTSLVRTSYYADDSMAQIPNIYMADHHGLMHNIMDYLQRQSFFFYRTFAPNKKGTVYKYLLTLRNAKQKNIMLSLLYIEDLNLSEENSRLLETLKKFEYEGECVLVMYKKDGTLRQELEQNGVHTFKLRHLSLKILQSFSYYKNIILYGTNSYKMADELVKYFVPYFWIIENENLKEEMLKSNPETERIVANTKNMLIGLEPAKIVNQMIA